MLVYCDSVILIYFFDHVGPFNVTTLGIPGASPLRTPWGPLDLLLGMA